MSINSFISSSNSDSQIHIIVDSFCTVLSQTVDDLQSDLRILQQSVISAVTDLQTSLAAFNASTQLDKDFAKSLIALFPNYDKIEIVLDSLM